jgi:hypothetical protein
MHEPYRVTIDTLVGEALFAVPGADQIFEEHGCAATFECSEEHHAEYTLGDTELVCHIRDVDGLLADLNRVLEAEDAERALEVA